MTDLSRERAGQILASPLAAITVTRRTFFEAWRELVAIVVACHDPDRALPEDGGNVARGDGSSRVTTRQTSLGYFS